MTILTLGPKGTFSHEGAKKLFSKKKIDFAGSIGEVFFRLAEPSISHGVIPLEMGEAFVEETIANLMKYDFSITGKVAVHLSYHLVGNKGKITHLFADPLAFQSCRSRIRGVCPQVKWIETMSVGATAFRFQAQQKNTAALLSPFARDTYQFPILEEEMISDSENFATFFSIGKKAPKKGKQNGTSFLLFSEPMLTIEKQITSLAHKSKIKLLKLKNLLLQEGHTPLYFIEVEGHIEEKVIHTLFEELSNKFLIKHLGSYPL